MSEDRSGWPTPEQQRQKAAWKSANYGDRQPALFRHTFDSAAVADECELETLIEGKRRDLETMHGIPLEMSGVEIGPGAAITVSWTTMAKSSLASA